jgi:carboxyl-terminal processing protease
VVLVNSGTASASEIVSGAIQDHDVGLVVGTPTWGKGLVQTVYSLSYGAGLALTTAKYYTPSGRLIQRDYRSFFDYYARTDVEPTGEGENAKVKAPGEEYSTDLGRKVYGGGGITPDFAVEPDEVAPPMQFLLARAAFFRFAIDWANRNPPVDREWQPQPAMVDELRAWLVREKLETPEEAAKLFVDDSERAYALRQIQAEVLSSRFGIEAAHQALSPGDAQIQAALALFPRAASLLAQREGLERAPEIQASESMRQ